MEPDVKVAEMTPLDLANEFKRSGEFDRLRKQMMKSYLSSPDHDQLLKEVTTLLQQPNNHTKSKSKRELYSELIKVIERSGIVLKSTTRVEASIRAGTGEGEEERMGEVIKKGLESCMRLKRGVMSAKVAAEPVTASMVAGTDVVRVEEEVEVKMEVDASVEAR